MTSLVLCRADALLSGAADAHGAVLGLDTGAQIASLAIVTRGRVVAEVSRPVTSHGASLPDAVDEMLGRAGLRAADLGAIAVGIGPGSFTGLRIGLSYAKGLAYALGCALVGVPSLDALAIGALEGPEARPGMKVCALVDARKGEVYTALYGVVANGLEKMSRDVVVPLDRLVASLEKDTILAGDEKVNDAAALLHQRGVEATVPGHSIIAERGRNIAAIGASRFARGEIDRTEALEPLYVRPPEAQMNRAGKHSGAIATEVVWSAERKNSFSGI